ncbi:MAG: hypothetical protein M3R24_39920 [Chloroflexota bacterium]|nr:hypothetical protein [Chloroflexota bacterium]
MNKLLRTTTIQITNVDYSTLAQHLKVVRYTLDRSFRFSNDKTRFGRLHNQLKEQLQAPYHFFSHDNPAPSIYVVYGRSEQPLELNIKLANPVGNLPWEYQDLEQLPRHLLIKLLLARYFIARRSTEFYSHNKYYVEAKHRGTTFTCLEIELRERDQEFKVSGRATRFVKLHKSAVRDGYQWLYPYFRRVIAADGSAFFSQLKPSQVQEYTGDIFRILRRSTDRPTLDYHSRKQPEATRGYVLYQFIHRFIDYLHAHGVAAQQKRRAFQEFKPQGAMAQLLIGELGTVNLLDLRMNQTLTSIAEYQRHLTRLYPAITFNIINEIRPESTQPTLILLDYKENDFADEGVFAHQSDPYKELYRRSEYRRTPKQSINVNPNDAETQAESYLTYSCVLEGSSLHDYALRFAVSLNQLFLKHLIINQLPVSGRLPGFLEGQAGMLVEPYALDQYAYIRKQTVAGNSYTVIAHVDNGRFVFLDTRSPEGKQRRDDILTQFGLDWYNDILEPFKERHYRVGNAENDLPDYDFIVGPSMVVEIEDMHERVLYEYEAIEERQTSLDEQRPIAWFRLSPYSHLLRPLSGKAIETTAVQEPLFDDANLPATEEDLFESQLKAFDAFLDEISATHTHVSFNELASGDSLKRVSTIFGLPADAEYKVQRRRIKGFYQTLGHFQSDKAKDVQTFSGIWFDTDNCFMVGDPESLNTRQPRAHLIRRFTVYQQDNRLFDPRVFLSAAAVKFVRYQQYTVLPYPFHLIDIFVDTQNVDWSD